VHIINPDFLVTYVCFSIDIHEKIRKKCFDPVTASSVKIFEGMQYIEVQTFFPTIWTSWVSKDAEFYADFKNINLP
jgi:hypothetical protein